MREPDASINIAAGACWTGAGGRFDSNYPALRRRTLVLGAGLAGWPAVHAQRARGFGGLAARIATLAPDVLSVAVVQRGALAFEFYRPGTTADSLHDVQSVTKSVLSLLFGCALADGHVRGVDELVAMRLPEMLRLGGDARLQRLRFAHLLTMTAGWTADVTARRDRDDNLGWLARRPFVAEPGARFAYDNGATNVLALALARAVGRPLDDYARQRLLGPLGIARFDWRRGAQGHAIGAFGLMLSPRDMARVGELVLAGGRWQGRELVPADYLRQATTRRNAGGWPAFTPYGYLWWVSPEAVMASGYGGQWIYVDAQRQAVIAATSRRTPDSAARNQALALIRREILPAVPRS
ncbi:MAG: serine hydrolase [Ottowia sp.]|uniref:serine hydrolase domain-containing protein n=1 Tax=Ottowia sp. TaxID=1898956 RepID=UPI0039E45441